MLNFINHAPFTSRDALGRYYTESIVSSLLVSQMDTVEAESILDLGCGEGSLSAAASMRWDRAKIVSLDIEDRALSYKENEVRSSHHVGDALNYNLPEFLGMMEGSIDLAICNPPYLKPTWRDEFYKVSEQIGIAKYACISRICSAEVLFLAQMLRMLREGGEAGVILPDGIFTAEKFSGFRRYLITEHSVKKVVQLPRRVFKRTEAQTYILILNKARATVDGKDIELREVDVGGVLSEPIFISAESGVSRLDYSYHLSLSKATSLFETRGKRLGELFVIYRGKHSSSKIRALAQATVHTTDLAGFNPSLKLKGKKNLTQLDGKGFLVACPGDLLIARVGRGFFKKIALVKSGYAIVSDCIFVLRAKGNKTATLYNELCSPEGQKSLSELSYGVAAAQMSMRQFSNLYISN